jgi:hypothetical protein
MGAVVRKPAPMGDRSRPGVEARSEESIFCDRLGYQANRWCPTFVIGAP